MQGEKRHKSLHAMLRLVVSAAVASGLISAQATAQQQSSTSAKDFTAAAQVAQSLDEAAFKQMLVKNSPWNVEWGLEGRTHKISFALENDGTTLTGKFFSSSSSSSDQPMKDIVPRKNCVRFVASNSGNTYDYCLTEKGTLKGTMSGISRSGNRFNYDAVAKPASR